MRFLNTAFTAALFLSLSPAAFSVELLTADDIQNTAGAFDHKYANVSEPVCRDNLRNQLLAQQIVFSDAENSVETRRHAEESIDFARRVYEETQSYCETIFALTDFIQKDVIDSAAVPKTGQIQSFDR